MKLDKIAWAIEGMVPVIIPAIIFLISGHKALLFCAAFAGSIAFTQLLSPIIKTVEAYPKSLILYRIDNILRIIILFFVIALIFALQKNWYLIFWILLNIFLLIVLGRLFFLGRLRYTFASFYSRALNFIFLFSYTYIAELHPALRLVNPFSLGASFN